MPHRQVSSPRCAAKCGLAGMQCDAGTALPSSSVVIFILKVETGVFINFNMLLMSQKYFVQNNYFSTILRLFISLVKNK